MWVIRCKSDLRCEMVEESESSIPLFPLIIDSINIET